MKYDSNWVPLKPKARKEEDARYQKAAHALCVALAGEVLGACERELYIPGGWIAAGSGHAIQYKLTSLGAEYLLEVFNTGAGISHHTQVEVLDGEDEYKQKIVTKKKYRIRNADISDALTALLKFKIYDVKAYKIELGESIGSYDYAADLYASLSRYPIVMEGEREAVAREQYSGTCTVRSFNEVLKELSRPGNAYIKIKYTLGRELLDNYFIEIQSTRLAKVHIEQLYHALHNFSGFVNKQLEKLGSAEFNKIFGSIVEIRKYIETKQEALSRVSLDYPAGVVVEAPLSSKLDHFDTKLLTSIRRWNMTLNMEGPSSVLARDGFKMSDYTSVLQAIIRRGPYKRYHLVRILENIHQALDLYRLPEHIELMTLEEFKGLEDLLQLYQQVVAEIYGTNAPARIYAFYRDIVRRIVCETTYFYCDLRNCGWSKPTNYIDQESTNPCAATMQWDVDKRTLKTERKPRSVYDYQPFFRPDIDKISRDEPRGIKQVIKELGITPPDEYTKSEEVYIWYVVIEFLNSDKLSRSGKIAKLGNPAIKQALQELVEKYDKIQYVREVTDTALDRARDVSSRKTTLSSFIKVAKYSDQERIYTYHYHRGEIFIPDLLSHSLSIGIPDVKKATFWGSERFESLFNPYNSIDSNHNRIECYSHKLKLRDTELESIAEISLRRLAYPHSNAKKAIDMLFSIFVGEDKKKLSEFSYQQFFQHLLFTPIYLSNHFAVVSERKVKFDSMAQYFGDNLKFFNKDNLLNVNAYLFNLRMLAFTGLYVIEQGVSGEEATHIFTTLLNNYLLITNVLDDIIPNQAQKYQIDVLRFIILQAKAKNEKCRCTKEEADELKQLYQDLSQSELQYADSLDLNTRYQLDRTINAYYLSLPLKDRAEIDSAVSAIHTNGARKNLPYNILHSLACKEIFGRIVNFECTIEDDGALILFEDKEKGISYRAIKETVGYIIQRKYRDGWYQYFSTQVVDQKIVLPKYMLDKKHKYWVLIDLGKPFHMICYTEEKYEPDYHMDRLYQNGIVRKVDADVLTLPHLPFESAFALMVQGSRFGKDHAKNLIHKILRKLSLFENISYIQICLNDDTAVFKLIRYNIEFKLDCSNPTEVRIVCLTSPGYYLDLDASSGLVCDDLLGVSNVLFLSNGNIPSAGSYKRRVLLPGQSYIIGTETEGRSSTWPLLKADTEGKIKKIDDSIHKIELSDSEKYYAFDIVNVDGEQRALPSTSAEAIYLAYINLGQNNIKQALHFLKVCAEFGGISGSTEELKWIYSIVFELPWNDPEVEPPIPQRDGYEYITARCKAMSLILTFKQTDRKWQFQDDSKSIPPYGSKEYDRHLLYISFLARVNTILLKEYERYLKVLRKVPDTYRLKKEEEISIFEGMSEYDRSQITVALQNRLIGLKKVVRTETSDRADTIVLSSPILSDSFTTARLIEDILPLVDDYRFIKDKLLSLFKNFKYYEKAIGEVERTLVRDVYEHLSEERKIAILAKTREAITMDGLIKAFLDDEEYLYGFNSTSTASIYSLIASYLKLKVQLNALKNIQSQVERISQYEAQTSEEQQKKYLLNVKLLRQLLLDSSAILQDKQIHFYLTTFSERVILVFQANIGICLRAKQIELLRELQTPLGTFVQMRMGGGKTKVLLPILVKQKAQRQKLPVVVVPKALFETNVADLNFSTMKAFGQQGKVFVFSRSSAKNAVESLKVLNFLRNTLSQGDYIITTPDSIQSLELKCYELLSSMPTVIDADQYRDWESSLSHMQEISRFLREKTDVIVDEGDLTFDIRKELQYACGQPLPYDKDYIQYGREMIAFLQGQTEIFDGMSLIDMILCSDDLNKTEITKALLTKILDDKRSPIYRSLEKHKVLLTDIIKKEILDFLQDKDAQFPDFSNWYTIGGEHLNDEELMAVKKLLSFYSIQIHHLLPTALNRKHNQHYGRPLLDQIVKPVDALIAIPYEAAKKPKHGSRFSNLLEEIDYTYQSGLLNPIPYEVGRLFVLDLYAACLSDKALMLVIQDKLRNAKVQGCEDIDFATINIENDADVRKVLKILNKSNAFRLWCAAQYGLGMQTYSSHVLSSTAISHASSYGCTMSMTGTPWNIEAMHEKLQQRFIADISGDEEVLDNLKDPQKTQIQSYTHYKENNATIAAILSHATDQTRALIDIAGSFRDLSNYEVATEIADSFKTRKIGIRYVLFFDIDNCLYALDCEDNTIKIKLPSTDKKTITAKLGCEPEVYFTYYDQQHTTGVDIKQMPDANALVLLDGHTLHRDILQGVMRMRQLPESQTLTVLIAQQFERLLKQKYYSDIADAQVNIHDILMYAKAYEATFVLADKEKSLRAKYKNIYAEGLYKILNISGLTAQHKHKLFVALSQVYQTYLHTVDTSVAKFFEPKKSEKQNIVDLWRQEITTILGESSMTTEALAVTEDINASVAAFHGQVTASLVEGGFIKDVGQSMETQVEQVVDTTLMTETQMRKEMSSERLMAASHIDYFDLYVLSELNRCVVYASLFPCGLKDTLGNIFRSFTASPNFVEMFIGLHPLRYGSKPVHKIAFYKNPDEDVLKACLITAQDAIDMVKHRLDIPHVVIVDLYSQPRLPEKFDERYQDQFKLLMAKAYFINGNFDLAIKLAPPWVTEYRATLYEVATKYLKNIRQPAMAYIVALESDASLQKLIKKLTCKKVEAELKQIIEEFTLDALDPDAREKIEQINSNLSNHKYLLSQLNLLVKADENLSNLDEQIVKIELAKINYEKMVEFLSKIDEQDLKICSTYTQNRIKDAVAKLDTESTIAKDKLDALKKRKDEIPAIIEKIELLLNDHNKALLDLEKNLKQTLGLKQLYTQKKTLDDLSSLWRQSYEALEGYLKTGKNKAILKALKPDLEILDATSAKTINQHIQTKKKLIKCKIAEQQKRMIVTILLLISIVTVVIFISLLLLTALPAVPCTAAIVISAVMAVGFLLSLLSSGNKDPKPPTIELKIPTINLKLETIDVSALKPDLNLNPGLYFARASVLPKGSDEVPEDSKPGTIIRPHISPGG